MARQVASPACCPLPGPCLGCGPHTLLAKSYDLARAVQLTRGFAHFNSLPQFWEFTSKAWPFGFLGPEQGSSQ